MEGAGLKVTRHSQWISTSESEYTYKYFVNYVNTNLNLLENLFYRNPNLNWVGSFSCYIYVIIASIMILENIFFFQLLWSFWSFAILKEMTVPDQIWSIFLCPSGGLQVTIFFVDIVDMMSSSLQYLGVKYWRCPQSLSWLTENASHPR